MIEKAQSRRERQRVKNLVLYFQIWPSDRVDYLKYSSPNSLAYGLMSHTYVECVTISPLLY